MSEASSDVRKESRASGYQPSVIFLTSCLPLVYLLPTSVIPDIGNRESTLVNLLFFLDTR